MGNLSISAGLRALNETRYEHVHRLCIAAIQKDVSNPVPYFLLGVLALDHRNFSKAEELFERAEKLDVGESHYPTYLARMYSDLRKPEQAEAAANRAAKLQINKGYLADILGVIYSRTGFHERAIEWFEKAVSLDSGKANFFYNLGASELFLGNFERARSAFLNATDLDKGHYGAWSSLVALKKQTPDENYLPHLKQLHTKLSDNEDAAHQLGHAIAKTLEDLGQHEDSLDWLHKAKAEKHKNFGYDRILGRETFAAAKATFATQSNGHISDQTPIFVVGLPRTGTTLVDRILSSHSEVRSAGELNFFADLVKSRAGTRSNLVLDADTLKTASEIDLREIGEKYQARVQNRLGTHPYTVDKMPFNFFYVALIAKALPKARIIALRRGAMDSCLSNYRQLLSVQESFYNYTYDLDDIAFFYSEFDRLMAHWRENLPTNQFTEVHYEDIVFDQENQTRCLLEFCGLEFEEACLRFHENDAPVSTASSVQVRQPLYSGSIGRWKKYGDKLDGLREALGDLAD